MTSPDDHTTDPSSPTVAHPVVSTLQELLATWQAWNSRDLYARAAEQAAAAGEHEQATRLRGFTTSEPQVAAVDALAAQREISSLLAGWEWQTVRAAREQGASWADIGHATRTDPAQARAVYVEKVERQEQFAARSDLPFVEVEQYRAAAGRWEQELYPDTPPQVVQEIADAIERGDDAETEALRQVWWNPQHVPPVTVFPAPTAAEQEATAQAQAAAERGDYAEARRLSGIVDAVLDAAIAAAAAGPMYRSLAPGIDVPVTESDEEDHGYTDAEAVEALAPLLGSRTRAARAILAYRAQHHPQTGPDPSGAVLLDADLIAIGYPDSAATSNTDTATDTGDDRGEDTGDNSLRVDDTPLSPLPTGGAVGAVTDDGDEDGLSATVEQDGSFYDNGPPAEVVHTFDPDDVYTDAEIREIADAFARGDDAEVARLEARRPSLVPDRAAVVPPTAPEVEMPGWMREKARATEAAAAAGAVPVVPTDDRAELAERVAVLRAEHDDGGLVVEHVEDDGYDAELDRWFDELCERHPLPGDGPGDWVTRPDGTFWHAFDETDELADGSAGHPSATATSDIWDDTASSASGEPGSAGRDDQAWWAPTGPDEVALSRRQVAEELGERGFTPELAHAAVSRYLDETSDRIGTSVHAWAMDSHDVEAIAHTHRPTVPVPEPRRPGTAEQSATTDPTPTRGDPALGYAGERDEWEQVRDGDPRSYEQMMSDAATALTTHRPGRPTEVEDARREQLMRWHTDDTTGRDQGASRDDGALDDEAAISERGQW